MQDLDNFRKELRLMAAVQHPNVMPLLAAHVLPPGPSCLFMLLMSIIAAPAKPGVGQGRYTAQASLLHA